MVATSRRGSDLPHPSRPVLVKGCGASFPSVQTQRFYSIPAQGSPRNWILEKLLLQPKDLRAASVRICSCQAGVQPLQARNKAVTTQAASENNCTPYLHIHRTKNTLPSFPSLLSPGPILKIKAVFWKIPHYKKLLSLRNTMLSPFK